MKERNKENTHLSAKQPNAPASVLCQYTEVMKGVTDNFTENTHLTVTCFGKSYPADNIK